ncbi:MAG: CoA transferase [Hyphomicrobiaceae bacterium]|nr:CoA transferase [Hyphomicrobiaceae bacterium]
MTKPLEGLLVIALEQAVAAPLCSRKLADAGARVIKLERPEGDFARDYDSLVNGESAYFVWLNRGKESVLIDLAKDDDKKFLSTLLAQADVFLQNLKPGATAKLGFAIPDLVKKYPRLICCSISGYGEQGPYAKRKAYDLLVQAESGLSSITGGPESPARVGVSVVDIATGMNAYEAILEALLRRAITGKGGEIQVSLFHSMAEWMSVPLLQAGGGKPPKRVGFSHPTVAPYGVFATNDGTPILISIQNDREWATFAAKILDRADLATDAKMATNIARVANRPEMDALIAKNFASRTIDDLARLLDAVEIAYGHVNDVMGLSKHPHLRLSKVSTPSGLADVPSPPAIHVHHAETFGPVPALGADNSRVRKEFTV